MGVINQIVLYFTFFIAAYIDLTDDAADLQSNFFMTYFWGSKNWYVINEVCYNQRGRKKMQIIASHCSTMLSCVTHFTSRSNRNLSKNQTVYDRRQCIKWS